jgi:hypothetical protein
MRHLRLTEKEAHDTVVERILLLGHHPAGSSRENYRPALVALGQLRRIGNSTDRGWSFQHGDGVYIAWCVRGGHIRVDRKGHFHAPIWEPVPELQQLVEALDG